MPKVPSDPPPPSTPSSRKGIRLTRRTFAQRIFLLLGPFEPEASAALVRAIATNGKVVDSDVADTYTRFLYYASRTDDPITFMLEIAACLQGGIARTPPADDGAQGPTSS